MLKKFKIRFYAYNPLAGGLLTGKHNNQTMIPKESRFSIFKTYVNRYWKERYFNAINEIKGVCDLHNIIPSEAALRWLIHHSKLEANDQDGIIIGASKIEQLKENLKACKEGKLPKEIVLACEKAWEIARCDSPKYFRD
jgi:aflatoxin B1 aldehyde reductase